MAWFKYMRSAWIKKHASCVISRIFVCEIDGWVLPALLQRLKGGGQPVSAQTIRYTLHQIGMHGWCPRRKHLLKMMHKKPTQFAEDKQTKDMDYWNHVLWSDETKINLFGSDCGNQVRSTKISVSCLQSSKPWMPTCPVTYWSRAWSPPFRDWPAGQYSNITTTALLKKLRVNVMDWPSRSPDLNPIEHLWGILKRKVEECKVSNIHQLCYVVMEEDSSGNLWSSGELHAQEG